MRKIIGTVVLLIVGISIIGAATHSNAPAHPTSASDSPALVTSTSTDAAAPAPAPKPKPKTQVFKGVGTENIGTIKVPTDSTLHWSCGSCGSDNFIVGNDFNDLNTIEVNGLNQTHGKTVIDAGTYHKVDINTEGQNWTLVITPGT